MTKTVKFPCLPDSIAGWTLSIKMHFAPLFVRRNDSEGRPHSHKTQEVHIGRRRTRHHCRRRRRTACPRASIYAHTAGGMGRASGSFNALKRRHVEDALCTREPFCSAETMLNLDITTYSIIYLTNT